MPGVKLVIDLRDPDAVALADALNQEVSWSHTDTQDREETQ